MTSPTSAAETRSALAAIPRFAVGHPVTVSMIFCAAGLLGVLALRELPVDLLPELEAPRIAVHVRSGDRTPEELEDRYARFLEASLATLPDVRSVRTVSATGRVLATVEYEWDADMNFALLDVQKRVAPLATDREVDSLTVRRFDPSAEPVVVLAVGAPAGGEGGEDEDAELDRLRRLAEDRVARVLERVPGVATVEVAGGRRSEVHVTADRHRLAAHGLSHDRLATLVRQGNAEAPGGTVEDEGQVHVIKGLGRFESLADVAALPLPARAEGEEARPARPLRLSEVADVAWGSAPVRGLVTLDGREAVSLSVFKEAGENTVAVSARIGEAADQLARELRDERVVVVRDQAGFIREAIAQVQWAAVLGVVLAVAVLFFFLRSLRAVALVAISIPLSIVATFALMAVAGLSLNLMTLGGLALGAGMLIDNAIVVLEAIVRRMEAGDPPQVAAERGASDVASAIVAATSTTCVVFLPVTFLHGVAAELFTDLAFTVVFALACSLAVALLLIPAAAARWLRPGARRRRERSGPSLLAAAVRRPTLVLVLALAACAAGAELAPGIGTDLLPTADPGEITARLLMPEGTRVGVTRQAARAVEQAVRESAPNAIQTSLAVLGEAIDEELSLTEDFATENQGVLRLRLRPRGERSLTTEQVVGLLDEAARHVEGLSIRFEPADPVLGRLAQRGPPIRVEVRGQEPSALERATADVASTLSGLDALFNVRSSFEDRRAEVRLDLDRTVLAALGLTPDQVAAQLRQRLGDEPATTFRREGEDRDVVVRASAFTLRTLPEIVLDSPRAEPVRLGDLASVRLVTSPSRVERSRSAYMGVVTAGLAPGRTLGEASRRVEAALGATPLPPGTRADLGGAEVIRRSAFQELSFAVLLAVALVYMLMASLFESVVHPFTILFTLPTAGVGVLLALRVTSTPFSVPALLGAVMLAGIAVNNGILLVDRAQRLRAGGVDAADAMRDAVGQRLRPILMTSLTTVLAMVPLSLGPSAFAAIPWAREWGQGAELRAPMAIAVIGGLTASTVLTLLVVPAAYVLLDRLRRRPAPAPPVGAVAEAE